MTRFFVADAIFRLLYRCREEPLLVLIKGQMNNDDVDGKVYIFFAGIN